MIPTNIINKFDLTTTTSNLASKTFNAGCFSVSLATESYNILFYSQTNITGIKIYVFFG